MQKDFYVDSIMGEWQYDKKTKDALHYSRKATVILHRDNALPYTDPEDFKEYWIFGEVVLTERKLISIMTSLASYFRGVEETEKTEKTLKIK